MIHTDLTRKFEESGNELSCTFYLNFIWFVGLVGMKFVHTAFTKPFKLDMNNFINCSKISQKKLKAFIENT